MKRTGWSELILSPYFMRVLYCLALLLSACACTTSKPRASIHMNITRQRSRSVMYALFAAQVLTSR